MINPDLYPTAPNTAGSIGCIGSLTEPSTYCEESTLRAFLFMSLDEASLVGRCWGRIVLCGVTTFSSYIGMMTNVNFGKF
jgi:hypothetical protein